MICRRLTERIRYDGSQLSAHWILAHAGLVGDAIVAFRGPCDVVRDEIADLADIDGPGIAGDEMLHFLWECFSTPDLLLAVHRQRLLSALALETLQELAPLARIRRDGDDLYCGEGKLSISIATVTPVSSVLHFAVNIAPGGAPVAIACLQGLGVEPEAFADRMLERVGSEMDGIAAARSKVRPKGEWRR